MENLKHLLAMGGYAIYVWPAYGITLLVFAINLFNALREKRRVNKIMNQLL